MAIQLRRVRRGDFNELRNFLLRADLPALEPERATLRRFRNIVADLGADFDVAIRNGQIVGFVHLSYARDLRAGNRARLLALIGESPEVDSALVETAINRALGKQCRDIAIEPGAWIKVPKALKRVSQKQCINNFFLVDLPLGQRHSKGGSESCNPQLSRS